MQARPRRSATLHMTYDENDFSASDDNISRPTGQARVNSDNAHATALDNTRELRKRKRVGSTDETQQSSRRLSLRRSTESTTDIQDEYPTQPTNGGFDSRGHNEGLLHPEQGERSHTRTLRIRMNNSNHGSMIQSPTINGKSIHEQPVDGTASRVMLDEAYSNAPMDFRESESDEHDFPLKRKRSSHRGRLRRGTAKHTSAQRHSDEEYVESASTRSDVSENFTSESYDNDNIKDFVEDDTTDRRGQRSRKRARGYGASTKSFADNDLAPRRPRRRNQILEETDSEQDLQAELEELTAENSRVHRRRHLRERTTRPDYAIPPPLPEPTRESLSPVVSKQLPIRAGFQSLYPPIASLGLGKKYDKGLFRPARSGLAGFDLPHSDGESSDEGAIQAKGTAGAQISTTLHTHSLGGAAGNLGRINGALLADADPISGMHSASFEKVGGLDHHIEQLKEMVSLPLLYPEIFTRFAITPPRGVLFHGPPGTGKTLMARALAASCSTAERQVAFYMRKGADCLSKWVGEAERQLRLLFDEAKANEPSIIFFDEIDGLAPVRSSKQDQIHASIVSTLLALMDGMDSRGQVVVIGATNRPDSIDPALRRPGRFDREFYFPLPSRQARLEILRIHTTAWTPPPAPVLLERLAASTVGYGGADLRALCTEAALRAVKRRYPQIYRGKQKLVIDPTQIVVQELDFAAAQAKFQPSTARSLPIRAAPLSSISEPLLGTTLENLQARIAQKMPELSTPSVQEMQYKQSATHLQRLMADLPYSHTCLALSGLSGMGQSQLASALLHKYEGVVCTVIDLQAIYSDSSSTAEATLLKSLTEARKRKPSIVYLPSLEKWWDIASQTLQTILQQFFRMHGVTEQIFLLVTFTVASDQIPMYLTELLDSSSCIHHELTYPSEAQRQEFFLSLLDSLNTQLPEHDMPESNEIPEVLALASAPVTTHTDSKETRAQLSKDRRTRLMLQAKLGPLVELLRTRYKRFKKPIIDEKDIRHLINEIDQDLVEGLQASSSQQYVRTDDGKILQVSTGKKFWNMDIALVEERLWNGLYLTPRQFRHDIEQIVEDVLTDNGDRERTLRVQEMHAQVLIHLEEMFDSLFTEECKRMAQRQIDRDARQLAETDRLNAAVTPTDDPVMSECPAGEGTDTIDDVAPVRVPSPTQHEVSLRSTAAPIEQQSHASASSDAARACVLQDDLLDVGAAAAAQFPNPDAETRCIEIRDLEPEMVKQLKDCVISTKGFSVDELEDLLSQFLRYLPGNMQKLELDVVLQKLRDLIVTLRSSS